MKVYEYSKTVGETTRHAHIASTKQSINIYMETMFKDPVTNEVAPYCFMQADRMLRNNGFEPIADAKNDASTLQYVQFNVWYYDFMFNEKRVRTFSRIEDANSYIECLVSGTFKNKYRFISMESVY